MDPQVARGQGLGVPFRTTSQRAARPHPVTLDHPFRIEFCTAPGAVDGRQGPAFGTAEAHDLPGIQLDLHDVALRKPGREGKGAAAGVQPPILTGNQGEGHAMHARRGLRVDVE